VVVASVRSEEQVVLNVVAPLAVLGEEAQGELDESAAAPARAYEVVPERRFQEDPFACLTGAAAVDLGVYQA
jgi:hypothetical protein